MKELLKEYEECLINTRFQVKNIEVESTIIKAALQNARGRKVTKLRDELKPLTDEKSILNSIISDLTFTIEWLKTGRQPGVRRGIERAAAYDREKPFDPAVLERHFSDNQMETPWDRERSQEIVLSKKDAMIVQAVLHKLSERDRDILLMYESGKSQYQIAEMLEMKRSTVQKAIRSAKKKIVDIRYGVYKEWEVDRNETRSSNSG